MYIHAPYTRTGAARTRLRARNRAGEAVLPRSRCASDFLASHVSRRQGSSARVIAGAATLRGDRRASPIRARDEKKSIIVRATDRGYVPIADILASGRSHASLRAARNSGVVDTTCSSVLLARDTPSVSREKDRERRTYLNGLSRV